MKKRIKAATLILSLATAALLIFSGCTALGVGSGTVSFELTDAPVDADNVEGVYITVTGLEYNKTDADGEDGWHTFEEFQPMGEPINLLDLTGGETHLLGNFEVTSGQYNQIRLLLDLRPEATYVALTDGTTEEITARSVAQTGFKLKNSFTVPYNGDVTFIIDWDVRKGLVYNANGYLLKSTMRLIAENEAGRINATMDNTSAYSDLVVFAYENDAYTDAEADAPADDDESRFPNAVASAVANDEGKYVLPFLAAGTYDLVVAGYNGSEFGTVLVASGTEDVEVESDQVTTVTLTLE